MKPVRVVPIRGADAGLLHAVAAALSPCTISEDVLDPAFAHHPERNQYHSTKLLERLPARDDVVTLAITHLDLYIPILTFVFGEAHLGGTGAIVSYHRLTQEFYGLPRDPAMLTDRLIKEAIHEIGHTAGLTHCDDYECVMASSHAVEWIDLKRRSFCAQCEVHLRASPVQHVS